MTMPLSGPMIAPQSRESCRPLRIDGPSRDPSFKNCTNLGHGFECLVFHSLRGESARVRRDDHPGMPRDARAWHLIRCPAHVNGTAGDQPQIERPLEAAGVSFHAALGLDAAAVRQVPSAGAPAGAARL
jgi:hypothetical protein